MKLIIVDKEGQVWDVVEDLEGYDLEKPLAASSVMQDIKFTIKSIKGARDD